MTLQTQTPFFFRKTGNTIGVINRRTHSVLLVYQQPNTKINIVKDDNLEVYFLYLYHKQIVEKEITYKYICSFVINF